MYKSQSEDGAATRGWPSKVQQENFHLFSEEEELYKRNRPLKDYFTQPEIIHFTILFGCGEKIARNHAYIQELLNIHTMSPDSGFILDSIKRVL